MYVVEAVVLGLALSCFFLCAMGGSCMFRLCIANTEEDWRPGTEQYKFIDRSNPGVEQIMPLACSYECTEAGNGAVQVH
uniref:Uncharacterized protein n=1 Tax=Zea mays TaxID=4577 RepID=A0A804QQP6_MAIZE